MKSIKYRVLKSFILVVFISISILDILLSLSIKNYYYSNSESLLENQIQTSVLFYNKYFNASTLEENVYDNVDIFWNQSDAQVQIYDAEGNLLMDSIGVIEDDKKYSDVIKVLKGEESDRWIGKVSYYDYKVMAVSAPIVVNNETVGVMRYIVSLESVDSEVNSILMIFLVVSIIVLFIAVILCLIIANSIILPIKELTGIAEKMASGDLCVRSNIRDNDEIGKLALTLNYMAEELLERDKLKDYFISSVSHELRTPLTAIKGWVITLEDENTDKKTLQMGLNIIEKESDRLGNMVEELLDFSRLKNGKAMLKKELINIKDFMSYIEVYMSQRAKIEKKELKVRYNIQDVIVNIDIDKIKQVIINLIDNAFKFTDEDYGKILLDVSQSSEGIVIMVKDNGSGISKIDLPKIKEKFYKGKNVKSRNGIGLSICDEIIKLHGGKLIIDSIENIGTRVMVIIPIEERGSNK